MILSKPINNVFKVKVNTILKAAKRRADQYFDEKIKSKINGLDNYDSLVILAKEHEALKKKIKKSDYIFYIEYASSPEWLISQFASRTFLLNVDESTILEEAVFLDKYRSNLYKAIDKIKKEIPLYTYNDFINGKICKYFQTFKYYRNTTEQDYYNIVKWQSDSVIKIISYESNMLINNIQIHLNSSNDPLGFIKTEKEIFEELMDCETNNPIDLKNILSKFHVFNNFDFNNYDNDLLLENYLIYKNQEFHWNKTDYNYIKPIVDFLDLKPINIFSNEFLIFHTLDKLNIWFDDVIKGKGVKEEYIFPDYKLELEKVQNDAKLEVEKLVKSMDEYIFDKSKKEDEIKIYLRELFESYRHRFNKIKDKNIMHLLTDDNEHVLLSFYTTNSFFGNDIEKINKNLKQNIIVKEMTWEIAIAFYNFFDTKSVYDKKDYGVTEISVLLNKMILKKKLYNKARKAQMRFFSHFEKYRLPMDIHFKNIQEDFKTIFSLSLKYLQDILDDSEPSNKIIFLQSRIKEIKQREINLRQFEDDYEYSPDDYKYSNLLKQFFEVEADFIKETLVINNFIIPQVSQTKLIESKDEKLIDVIDNAKLSYILKMLEELAITNNGKSILSERRKGAIRGIVESLRENSILPNINLDKLCKLIADEIGLKLTSKLDFSSTSNDYNKKANEYINTTPLH
jgi:hypothetical protein